MHRSLVARTLAVCGIAALALVGGAAPGHADDHLANGTSSAGADDRGFANPVAGNPSGTAGAASQPGTVPGLGSPNAGQETGTPSFDCPSLAERLAARSMGDGPAC
jgi:hypothetical protein